MPNTPPLKTYKKIVSIFVVLTVVLVLIILYFSITYAYINITPNAEIVEAPFNVLITEEPDAVQPQKGIFEGIIVEQELEATGTFSSTGLATLTSEATGTVLIINNYVADQPLVATTRLLTEGGDLFRISETVTVPAGGRVEVEAYQDDPEVLVQVTPGQRFTIPGLNQAKQEVIYAEAVTDFAGDETQVGVISKEDLDAAVAALVRDLETQVAESAPNGSEVAISSEVISKDFSHLAQEQVEEFTATVRVRVTGVIFDHDAVSSFGTRLLEKSITDQKELVAVDQETISYTVETIDRENNIAHVSGLINGNLVLRKDAEVLSKDRLIKLSGEEAVGYLENLDEVASAEVQFFPFWVNKVPVFEDHIIITIRQ